jgi:hypothetical protein
MLIAFGVLLPCGLLLARHKWLFVDEELVRVCVCQQYGSWQTQPACAQLTCTCSASHPFPIHALQGLSPFWALSHLCVLLAAALTALVGMIVVGIQSCIGPPGQRFTRTWCSSSTTAVTTRSLCLAVLRLLLPPGSSTPLKALVRFGNSVDAMVMSTHQVLGLLSVGERAMVHAAVGA